MKKFAPADAIQAAPIFAMDACRVGLSALPDIKSVILYAISRAITPVGIPVRGGVGEIGVPFWLCIGFEIG